MKILTKYVPITVSNRSKTPIFKRVQPSFLTTFSGGHFFPLCRKAYSTKQGKSIQTQINITIRPMVVVEVGEGRSIL